MIRPKQSPTDLNLNSIKFKQTIDFKRHELVEKKGAKWLNVDKNKTRIKIQRSFKTKIAEEQPAFRNYADSDSITKRNKGNFIHKISRTSIKTIHSTKQWNETVYGHDGNIPK